MSESGKQAEADRVRAVLGVEPPSGYAELIAAALPDLERLVGFTSGGPSPAGAPGGEHPARKLRS